jgi:hypothetical protein
VEESAVDDLDKLTAASSARIGFPGKFGSMLDLPQIAEG